MNRLYVNGCSFSCAGGLDIPEVKELYSDKGIVIENHLDFSWANILSNKLNVELVNQSVQGGSINRLIRTTIDHLIETNFSTKYFYILQLPTMWRDEVYSNKLKRFVNITYGNLKNPEFDRTEEVNNYPKKEFLKIHKDVISWFDSFIDYDVEIKKVLKSLIGLILLFKEKNIKFIFLENDVYFRNEIQKLNIDFPYIELKNKFNKSFSTIKDEIGYYDGHMGIDGNKSAANLIYEFLIKNNIFIVK